MTGGAKVIPITAARSYVPPETELGPEPNAGGIVVVAIVQKTERGWVLHGAAIETGSGEAIRRVFSLAEELKGTPDLYIAELRLETAAFVLGATLIPSLDIF